MVARRTGRGRLALAAGLAAALLAGWAGPAHALIPPTLIVPPVVDQPPPTVIPPPTTTPPPTPPPPTVTPPSGGPPVDHAPEPATLVTGLVGAVGVGLAGWWRRRKAAAAG